MRRSARGTESARGTGVRVCEMGTTLSLGCNEGISHLYRLFGSGSERFPQQFWVKGRCFRVRRELGEGGYAFVYLVHEVKDAASGGGDASGDVFALKRVLIQSPDQMKEVRLEVDVQRRLSHHENILTLLEVEVVDLGSSGKHGEKMSQAMLLFPAYEKGSMLDYTLALQRGDVDYFTPRQLAKIFIGLCSGLAMMHDEHGLAHRDVKPGNVLFAGRFIAGVNDGDDGLQAILIDFGSCKKARTTISNRQDALAMQEDAERTCTAPFRCPELWDVPSECVIDEKVDIWALGCTLYACMMGKSPFESAIEESGGSLMLAVMSGKLKWWDEPGRSASSSSLTSSSSASPLAAKTRMPYPEYTYFKAIVEKMLQPESGARPSAAQVLEMLQRVHDAS